MRDLAQFAHYILRMNDVPPAKVEREMIEHYMGWLYSNNREKSSQARALSGIKSFFNFLLLNELIDSSPAEMIEAPKASRQLPDTLSTEEIDRIINSIDASTTKGLRDRAILELLYSCGLRVSELCDLKLGDLCVGEGYIRVIGKGNKQRLVPVSGIARERISLYKEQRGKGEKGDDTLFLNNRGSVSTRWHSHSRCDPQDGCYPRRRIPSRTPMSSAVR